MSDQGLALVTAFPPAPPTPYATAAPKTDASSPVTFPTNLDGVKNVKRRAVHSAHTPSSLDQGRCDKNEPFDLPRRKRVQSAVENRQVVSLSSNNTPYGSKVWGQTSYSMDYPKKKPIPLPKVRPSSATRMHNPQPSKMFLQWRIPTRIHPHSRAVAPSPDILKDIEEGFYADYSSNERPGEVKYEVPIINVAKIPFPGTKKSTGLQLTGKSMALAARGSNVSSLITTQCKQGNREKVFEKALKPSSYAALQDWIQTATDKEKEVLEKMLKAAHIEESRIRKVLSEVFSSESKRHIQEWLRTASEEELKIALSVLNNLAMRSQKFKGHPPSYIHRHSKHCKVHSRTWPREKSISPSKVELGIQGVSALRSRPHSAEKCSHCNDSDVESLYKSMQNKGKPKVWKPEPGLWHHRVKPPQESKLLNIGSVFNQPQKTRGQHFALHPEWPIA